MDTQLPLDLPPSPDDLLGMTTCDNQERCLRGPFPLREASVVNKHTGQGEQVFHFCSETCANDFYLDRLRTGL